MAGATLEVLSADPGLLADKPDLVRAAVAPMLKELSEVISKKAQQSNTVFSGIATAGVQGVLSAIADDPALMDSRYPQAVSKVAQVLAGNLADGKLTPVEVGRNSEARSRNHREQPGTAGQARKRACGKGAERSARKKSWPMTSSAYAGWIWSMYSPRCWPWSQHMAKGCVGDDPVDKLVTRIAVVIDVGLQQSSRELGKLLDRTAVPLVLASLLRRWALDGVETLDINDPRFQHLFAVIVNDVLDRAA